MNYLLISNLALLIFFLIYRFGLKNLTFFGLNRWYLLSSVLISYLMPLFLFIDFRVPELMQVTLPVIELTLNKANNTVAITKTVEEIQQRNWIGENWLMLCYWIGVVVACCILIYRAMILLRGNAKIQQHRSYSFFGKIMLAEEGKDNQIIRKHEEIHVSQGHSYDILFIELVRAFNWFNPVLIWMRDELKFQHECIVDEHFSVDRIAYAELLVAQAMNADPHQLSHEFSNKSQLKERIEMIFKDKSKSKNRLFYLAILPMAVMLFGLTVNCKSPNKDSKESRSEETALSSPSKENAQGENVKSVDTVKLSESDRTGSAEETKDGYPGKEAKATGTFGVFSYDQVEVKPEYPGGINQFRNDVSEAFEYPQEAIDAGATGELELSFVINKEGKPVEIKVVKDFGYGSGLAAVKAVKSTKTWKPGKYKGLEADVTYNLPLRLNLTEI